jgi:Uma2 family endonuclease
MHSGSNGKNEMPHAPQKEHAPLAVEAFRNWLSSRPDEERWELIDGVPMMMAPATRDHQRIASNLERLLNDALERTAAGGVPRLAAYQRIGLNLGPAVQHYDPEPDVAVVEVAAGRDPRYADSFLLAAEVVSPSDLKTVQGKAEIYKLHRDCACVLVIYQDHCEVSVELRKATRWTQQTLLRLRDRLVLTAFGLDCAVGDLYKGTVEVRGLSP